MFLVMYYFGGVLFKWLELLYEGWGILMFDVNQWMIVNLSDDLFFVFYKVFEQYVIQRVMNFWIDDIGLMVIVFWKQIDVEFVVFE